MVRLTSWDRNGKDAAYIVAGIIDGRFDPENFDAFWKEIHRGKKGTRVAAT